MRYSEAFKLQVIRELEEGKYGSCHAASVAYRIRGATTVQRWAREYGREHLTRRVIRVETTEERDEMRRLRERVRQLESALSSAHLDLKLEAAYLAMACETAGIEDVGEFKKKHAGRRSTR